MSPRPPPTNETLDRQWRSASAARPLRDRRSRHTPIAQAGEWYTYDTIPALKDLLALAEARQLRGMAFVGIMSNNRHIEGATGACLENAPLSRGLLLELSDQLSRLSAKR